MTAFTYLHLNDRILTKHVGFLLVRTNPVSYHSLICSPENWIKTYQAEQSLRVCTVRQRTKDNYIGCSKRTIQMLSRVLCASVAHFFGNVTSSFQHLRVCTIASASSLFCSNRLTSAQFRILYFFKDLVVSLGLSGAPVAFLLQHVADHHPDEAQQEENGNHGQNRIVWAGLFSIFRNCRWRRNGDRWSF